MLKKIIIITIFSIVLSDCNEPISRIVGCFNNYPKDDSICFIEYNKNILSIRNCFQKNFLLPAAEWSGSADITKSTLSFLNNLKTKVNTLGVPREYRKYYLLHLDQEIKRISWYVNVKKNFNRKCISNIIHGKGFPIILPNEFYSYIYWFRFNDLNDIKRKYKIKDGICGYDNEKDQEILLTIIHEGNSMILGTKRGKFILINNAKNYIQKKDGSAEPTILELYRLNVLTKEHILLYKIYNKNGFDNDSLSNGVLNNSESIVNDRKNLYYFNHVSGNLKKIFSIPENMKIGGYKPMLYFLDFHLIISSKKDKFIVFPASYDGIKKSFIVIDFNNKDSAPIISKQPQLNNLSLDYAFSTYEPMRFEENK